MDESGWTANYLLGMVSEVDEVLREINWKAHRAPVKEISRDNLAMELADLTKYIMSLWQIWGFTLDEMLEYVEVKSEIMEQIYLQEMMPLPDLGQYVAFIDLDGTVADYRQGLFRWMQRHGHVSSAQEDISKTLNLCEDWKMKYGDYRRWKDEFESSGGYRNLPSYPDALKLISALKSHDVYTIVTTARPAHELKRIWYDTWLWLKDRNIKPDQLYFISLDRVIQMESFLSQKYKVILFDDDPIAAMHACELGPVYLRKHGYNQDILKQKEHDNIRVVENFQNMVSNILDLWVTMKART